MAAARCRNKKKERTDYLQKVRRTTSDVRERAPALSLTNRVFHVFRPPGIREAGDVKLGLKSPDRGAEAGAAAAHPHAQPPPADVHSADRQRQNPGERGQPFAGAAGRQVKGAFMEFRLERNADQHAALSPGLRRTEGTGRRWPPNPRRFSDRAPHEGMQIQWDWTLGI